MGRLPPYVVSRSSVVLRTSRYGKGRRGIHTTWRCSVPPERIFGHDGGRYLLCPHAAALAAPTSAAVAAGTTRSGQEGSLHRSIRVAASRRHRACALMRHSLLPVPSGDIEHSSAVSDSTNDGAGRNACTRGIDLVAGIHVASNRTTFFSSTGVFFALVVRWGI